MSYNCQFFNRFDKKMLFSCFQCKITDLTNTIFTFKNTSFVKTRHDNQEKLVLGGRGENWRMLNSVMNGFN